MKAINIFFVMFFMLLFPSLLFAQVKNIPCGSEWINIHKKNPDLIGVYVQQYPDNLSDKAAYKGKHPCMVIFVFKGNKAHQVSYTPTGQVESGFWWDIPEGDALLKNISNELKPNIYCGFWVKPKKENLTN